MMNANTVLRFLACGSVDDGKSTLIGHLLDLTGNIYDDQMATLKNESCGTGSATDFIDYSLLLDGLSAEREQGITIDVAYRYFSVEGRKFIVADTPGHEQYTRNMATGASRCSAAMILVDAEQEVLPQTRRHALICSLMGIRKILFVINKMDRIRWSEGVFKKIAGQCSELLSKLETFGLSGLQWSSVPVSALHGDNLTTASTRLPWFSGPTVVQWLLGLDNTSNDLTKPARLPVQYLLKAAPGGEAWQNESAKDLCGHNRGLFRAYCGTLASGTLQRGQQIAVLPSAILTTIREIWSGAEMVESVTAGMAIAVTVDGDFDIVRGDCISPAANRPENAAIFKTRIIWMDEQPLYAGRQYMFRGACGTTIAEVTRIRDLIDLTTIQRLATDRLSINDTGEVVLNLSRSIPFDPYHINPVTGGFLLVDRLTNRTVACGMILHAMRRSSNIMWHKEELAPAERAGLKGQQPKAIWLTGLSGSGKSTIANCLERRLHEAGHHTMLLDGDNVRHGLNKDLGFSEADRIENIRRIGEVAKLMTDAGLIVITAFISPYRTDREMVRKLLAPDQFIEVFVDTPLAVCKERDPKGLYEKARQGVIPNFTGVSSPYEAPLSAELTLDTTKTTAEECVEAIIKLL